MKRLTFALFAHTALVVPCSAALVLNSPIIPKTHRVFVNPIVVSDDDGSNTANYFGTPAMRSEIIGYVDDIWAQAGVDVEFLSATTYNSTFTNQGTGDYSSSPRPVSDMDMILGDSNAPLSSDPSILNFFFINVVPGTVTNPPPYLAGLGAVDANGITAIVSNSSLENFGSQGLEDIASIVSHELGHNLGLDHETDVNNLMTTGATRVGQQLNQAQIDLIFTDTPGVTDGFDFLQPIPEPGVIGLLSLGVLAFLRRRTR